MHARVWGAVFVVLAIVASGCLSGDQAGGKAVSKSGRGAKAVPAPADASFIATLPDGTIVDASVLAGIAPLKGAQSFIGFSSYEPTLGATPKGNVFMSGLSLQGGGTGPTVSQGNLPDSRVYATYDQGATWSDVSPKFPAGPVHDPPYSADPFVYVDQVTGRVFTVDLQLLYCAWTSYSDDEGKTWTTSPVGCGQPPVVHDHQSIATGKARTHPATGYQNRVVYYCVNRLVDSACASSLNGGLSYGALIPATTTADTEAGRPCGALHGHVKTDNAGRVLLPKSSCGVPSVIISENDGLTWTAHAITRTMSVLDHEVNVAVDKADNIYAFWIGDNGLPYLSISKDHGNKWTPPRMVAPPGVTATDKPTIAASDTGKVAFAYIGSTIEGGYKNRPATGMNAAKAWQNATWNAYIGEMTDALAENAVIFTTTANPVDDPIAVGPCGKTRCGGLYDFIGISIDPKGRPWVSLVDVCFEACIAGFRAGDAFKYEPPKGFAGTLATGPALLEAGGALPPLSVFAPVKA